MGTLLLHTSAPELDGHVLHPGDTIELWIFGSWICGTLIYDHTGWSLVTAKHVRIRPSQGLLARLCPSCPYTEEGDSHSCVQEVKDA
jgi:hypothetical protein